MHFGGVLTNPTDLKIQDTLKGLWLLKQKEGWDLVAAKGEKAGRKPRKAVAIPLDVKMCSAGCVRRAVSTPGPVLRSCAVPGRYELPQYGSRRRLLSPSGMYDEYGEVVVESDGGYYYSPHGPAAEEVRNKLWRALSVPLTAWRATRPHQAYAGIDWS